MTTTTTTIIPAYGRDYTSKSAAEADWKAGKDFQIQDMASPHDGRYCSIRDNIGSVLIRYSKLEKITIVKGAA